MSTTTPPNDGTTPSETVYFNIEPYQLKSLPHSDALLKAAEELIAETQSWKTWKTYKKGDYNVEVIYRSKGRKDGAIWYARRSVHVQDHATFQEFVDGLSVNKPAKEVEFIPELKQATILKQIQDTPFSQTVWSCYYEFPPPISPRVFTVLQSVRPPQVYDSEKNLREVFIISIPVVPDEEMAKKENSAVRGRFAGVERLRELEGGKTEWTMATTSTPGGSIPTFVAERSIPGSISMDVPHFLEWVEKQRTREIGDAVAVTG